MLWNKSDRLEELISHFGQPNFSISCRNDSEKSYWWFGHKIFLSVNNYILDLRYKKINWWDEKEVVWYHANGERWRVAGPAVQAAWRMLEIDNILLGENDNG